MGRGDVKVRKFRYLNMKKVKADCNTHLTSLVSVYTGTGALVLGGELTCEGQRPSRFHPRRR